jgi:aminopeptidase N
MRRRPRFGACVAITVCILLPAAAPAEDGYDILATTLALVPDIAARSLAGVQTTALKAETDLTELVLDASALTVATVTLDGEPLTWRTTERALVLVLPRTVRAGETAELRFEYHGAPARGLVFDDDVVYTSYFSCDWMLCALDRPGDKFTLELAVAAPTGWQSLTSEVARAYPAYVQGFAAGIFTTVRERHGATEIVYASSHATASDLEAIFAETPRMLEFFEDVAGVPFPHGTYTQLLVRGAAAQEAAGFAVLGDDTVRSVLTQREDDWAIAHELAHQYWGNLVTCVDWSEFWLNEGLATFMTAAWKERRWGEAWYERELDGARTRWAAVRAAGWDRPLTSSGAYPDLRTRRAIQYSKGALFFVELRRLLGDDAFWRALRSYTVTHAGGTVESADLQRAFEAASGLDLSALFAEWVYEGDG